MFGGTGNDVIVSSDGNDFLHGGPGDDMMEGGNGDDTYVVDSLDDGVVERVFGGIDEVRLFGIEYVMGDSIENVRARGGAGNVSGNELDNAIAGSTNDNTLYGADGDDCIKGNEGRDILRGGFGDDILIGGTGQDRLTGGEGAGRFVFQTLDDSKPNRNFADIIRDFFQSEGDTIKLSDIDADTTTDGDQAFTFIGTDTFSGTAGELRYVSNGVDTFVEADVDGDGRLDMTIQLFGVIELTAGDFIL